MKLEVAVADVSQCLKELTVEVPAEEVKSEFEKAYEAYQRYVKVPGFRPGRVPRGVVKQRFSKEVKDEVTKQLLPHALEHAIRDNKLRVVGDPAVLDLSLSEGESMKFKVGVEVLPEFDLNEYKGLKATKRIVLVSDEEIEKTLQAWRESAAETVTVEDRSSQLGDVVAVNLIGKYVEPPEEEDLKAEDVPIELGAEGTHAGFTENLTGVKAGDTREFRIVYPQDFTSTGLAGKTLDFTATVLAVREKELPELDDEFAQQFGEHETIQALRERIREDMVKSRARQTEAKLRGDLLDQLLEGYDFDVPPSIVEQQASERAREFAYLLMRNGFSRQAIKDWDWAAQMNQERARAIREIRATLIASKINEAEHTRITGEELDAEIERLANASGEPFDQLKARLTKEQSLPSIESRLLYEKALDIVVNGAEITVEEVTAEQEAERNAAEQEVARARAMQEIQQSAEETKTQISEESQAAQQA